MVMDDSAFARYLLSDFIDYHKNPTKYYNPTENQYKPEDGIEFYLCKTDKNISYIQCLKYSFSIKKSKKRIKECKKRIKELEKRIKECKKIIYGIPLMFCSFGIFFLAKAYFSLQDNVRNL
jgi:hypothetical protein